VASLLLIDDDDALREYLAQQLKARGHSVEAFDSAQDGLKRMIDSAQDGLKRIIKHRFDIAVLDNRMPLITGLECVMELRARGIEVPVILMTASPTAQIAMRAGSHRAVSYVVKPLDWTALIKDLDAQIGQILDRARASAQLPSVRFPSRIGAEPDPSGFVGTSKPMLEVLSKIGRSAIESQPVLVLGETGTGKELVARAIHAESPRKAMPFVAVNCAATNRDLADTQFFGHKKGAFTGADRDHIGFFERADGGTLFLDEVGELPLETQAKLLRVLQEPEFERLGGTAAVRVDVRVIAATLRDLRKWVQEGKFREDLYNRLEGSVINLPPLRERLDDLPELVDCILERETRTGRRRPEVAEIAMDRLRAYHWPGNVRELNNIVRRALQQCQGTQILPSDLELPPCDGAKDAGGTKEDAITAFQKAIARAFKTGGPEIWHELEELLGQTLVKVALEQCGNKTAAVKRLGMSPNTLNKFLKEDKDDEKPGKS
jgi:DNA-binding NtrC family response regulator